ncbi:uncharacterized protein LOC124364939 isoform X2 [Homalodisca vitripennis]|uniref:uncharacterized protein LOC124364939 isoform X2 n=1 Tax=Homalodisca vitripennis TaxID=197043 RepID=UPI001EEA1A68|nr:uncharacterized protein LOC124364939 isoform X2 [Homalodisca vitripennis]KAG8286759.1 hypothetical protein J6590_052805 [Homalodisca vitripennis]
MCAVWIYASLSVVLAAVHSSVGADQYKRFLTSADDGCSALNGMCSGSIGILCCPDLLCRIQLITTPENWVGGLGVCVEPDPFHPPRDRLVTF